MKKNKIFVACDTSNLKLVKKIIKQTKTTELEIIPKFGLQFYYSKQGRKFLEKYKTELVLKTRPTAFCLQGISEDQDPFYGLGSVWDFTHSKDMKKGEEAFSHFLFDIPYINPV